MSSPTTNEALSAAEQQTAAEEQQQKAAAASSSSAAAAAEDEEVDEEAEFMEASPLVILVIGMAGTGKTTLVKQLQTYSQQKGLLSYFMNLDPAVTDLPYGCHIDIRDTVNYREVMTQYRLGPNGAILTSLNLFATKFHQVIGLLENRRESLDWIVVDTPGQIEVFTWSASGQLIAEAFSSTFPTCLLFVGDTPRCINPQTFMSNMMYSSSIMFKTQLPLLLAMNKVDVSDADTVVRWMKDTEALCDVLRESKGYAATLTESLSLFVNEYYSGLEVAKVSALSGLGFDLLDDCLERCKVQYMREYFPLLKERQRAEELREKRRQQADIARHAKDVAEEGEQQ